VYINDIYVTKYFFLIEKTIFTMIKFSKILFLIYSFEVIPVVKIYGGLVEYFG